jgi:hypothetical protein
MILLLLEFQTVGRVKKWRLAYACEENPRNFQ